MIDKRRMGLKAAARAGALVHPHQMSAFVKYAFIARVVRDLGIEVILDVGANRGQFAQSMRDIGFAGQIVSFEPVAEQFAVLERASANDSKWQALNFAAGENEEAQQINVMKSGLFSSFNAPSAAETALFRSENEVVDRRQVGVRRLEAVIDELGLSGSLPKTLLKSDTQGYEMSVFRGMGEKLRSLRAILAEVSSIAIYENAPDMIEILSFLKDHGFLPVSFFPVNCDEDWRALEFDYLCVNRGASR